MPEVLALPEALLALRAALAGARLHLATPGADDARRDRDGIIGQIDDHLLPRLRDIDAPLLVVVGGSTGAGKSTLVNSLVGHEVSAAGVLRPTTRAPVLLCHPADVHWFADDRVLPGLARSTGAVADHGLQLRADAAVPQGLALLDTPDIDSVVTGNRELAAQLLAAGDLWLFTTTAARYADAVPWELLATAAQRSTALAVVLDRVPPAAAREVGDDLARMLAEHGLGDAALLVVPESTLVEGLLPADALAPVRGWLDALGADAARRADVVRVTLMGALRSLDERVAVVTDAVAHQAQTADDLAREVDAAYAAAEREVRDATQDGTLLRGEVMARWQEFVGTGELMRSLEHRIGRLRDRLKAAIVGRPVQEARLEAALTSSIESVVRAAADRAADRAAEAWGATPAGRELLGGDRSLTAASPALPDRAAHEVHTWQGVVLDLVAQQGAGKRSSARLLSAGVNAAGLVVMVGVFAHTGGLTGGEVVVAGGTATLAQKLLEAVFGDQAVRALAVQARTDLHARTDRLLGDEAARFHDRLAPVAPGPDSVRVLEDALAALRRARVAA